MISATQDTGSAEALIASLNTKRNSTLNAEGSVAATEDRFLKLLVTQMKNQDPLNPMDNAQVSEFNGLIPPQDIISISNGMWLASKERTNFCVELLLAGGDRLGVVIG